MGLDPADQSREAVVTRAGSCCTGIGYVITFAEKVKEAWDRFYRVGCVVVSTVYGTCDSP